MGDILRFTKEPSVENIEKFAITNLIIKLLKGFLLKVYK